MRIARSQLGARIAGKLRSRVVLRCAACLAFATAITMVSAEPVARGLRSHPMMIRRIATNEKVVALTFDDGPHPLYTPQLLKELDRYHIKATFFMIGKRMERWPEIVDATVEAGHVVANHTYSHPRYLAEAPADEIAREIDHGEAVVERMTGQRYGLFRPPRGLVGPNMLSVAQWHGQKTVLWSVSGYHHESKTPYLMAQRVIARAHPGSIILMHDGRYPMRWKDVVAAPLIIDGLRKKGYRFVTVPELLKMGRALATSNPPHAAKPTASRPPSQHYSPAPHR